MFKRDVALAQEYLAFLLLNLFDLFLTGYIFAHHGMEANAVAVFVLDRFHLVGFVIYKFLMVMVVVLACEGIFGKYPFLSRIIVTFGCVVYVCIVFYEVYQILTNIYGVQIHAPVKPDASMIAPALAHMFRYRIA